jgi:hypothetical protein
MVRWCGTAFGGEPAGDEPEGTVALLGGEAIVVVDLYVGPDADDDEGDGCRER